LAVPPNTTALTAATIATIPTTILLQVDDSGTTYDVWYSYTPSTSRVISLWAFGDLAVYKPHVELYSGPAASPVLLGQSAAAGNTPLQWYLTSGTQYFIKVETNAGNPTPANLSLSLIRAPDEAIPVGSIIINDDTDGFPAAVLDPTTGDIVRFIQPFPAGESVAALSDGTTMWSDEFHDLLYFYDSDFTLIATVPNPGALYQLASDLTSMFYAAASTTLQAISPTGTFGTTWTLANSASRALAVSLDNTIAYYSATTANTPIRQHNLLTDTAMSDLVAGIGAGYQTTQDILVLADGTLIVGYNNGTTTFQGRHYSAAGATLHSYTIDATNGDTTNRLALAVDNPLSFWAWSHRVVDSSTGGSDVTLLQRIRVGDGSVLQSLELPVFNQGAWTGNATADPPRFGHSQSCPLFITMFAADDPDEEEDDPDDPPDVPPSTTPRDDCHCPTPGSPPGGSIPPDGPGGGGDPGPIPPDPDREPDTLCDGGGTVGVYPTATPGESMDGVTDERVWAAIAFQSFDAAGEATDTPEYYALNQTMPDPPTIPLYGGRKDGRGLGMSRIVRGMSDEQGNYAVAKVTLKLNDKDRAALRTRLGDSETRFVWEREGAIFIASEGNRRSHYATTPRRLFRGVSYDVNLNPGFTGSISFEDQIGSQFGKFGPDREFPSRLLRNTMLPAIPKEIDGKPQQWIFGIVSDEFNVDGTVNETPKGVVPIHLVGNDGANDHYHLAAHEVCGMVLYGSDGGTPAVGETEAIPAHRVPLTEGSDYTIQVMNLLDTDTNLVHRVTHLLVPQDSVHSEDHKASRVSMAANVAGVMDNNGNTITDLFFIYQWIFEHIVLPTQESLTAEQVGSPQWPSDAVYMVESESFTAAQDFSITRIGGDGYQGGFVIGGPVEGAITLRELLRRMSNSGDCWFSWTQAGQLRCNLLDDAANVDDSPILREPVDLREMPVPTFALDEVENPVLFAYAYDNDKQKYRVAQEQVDDTLSFPKMGRARPSKGPVAMRCTCDPETARDVAVRRLIRRRYPPAYVQVVEPLVGLDREPGDILRVTSQEGVGESGMVERPMWIKETSYDPQTRRVTHTCRDLTDVLEGAAAWMAAIGVEDYGDDTQTRWANEDGEITPDDNELVTVQMAAAEWR
jgi:hypothetical protein